MRIRFLAHAGFHIEDGESSVVVDPWFFSSTIEEPVLHSVLPPHRTIDFQQPDTVDDIATFKPDAVLVSHFHTHHSPVREIRALLSQSKGECPILCGPASSEAERDAILSNIGPIGKRVDLRCLEGATMSIDVGKLRVTAFTSTWPNHAIWYVQSPTGSFLHVADARICRNPMDRRIDSLWRPLEDLRPDFMAVACSAGATKAVIGGRRTILDNSTLSPVEAARLVQMVRPGAAGVMGIFNWSAWTNRTEFILPVPFAEEQFRWAVGYLDPQIKCTHLRPGWELTTSVSNEVRCFDEPRIESPARLFD